MIPSIRNLQRLPFTIGVFAAIVLAGIFSQSYFDPTSPEVRRAFGSSLQTMSNGEVGRLLTSIFFTSGGWHFWFSIVMLALCVGFAEWNFRTRRTVVVFFAVHSLALITICVGLTAMCQWEQFAFAKLLVDARDVGPSAGYYGCLGFATVMLNRRWRNCLVTGMLIVMLTRVGQSAFGIHEQPHLVIGDVAHLIAFPLGMLMTTGHSRG